MTPLKKPSQYMDPLTTTTSFHVNKELLFGLIEQAIREKSQAQGILNIKFDWEDQEVEVVVAMMGEHDNTIARQQRGIDAMDKLADDLQAEAQARQEVKRGQYANVPVGTGIPFS